MPQVKPKVMLISHTPQGEEVVAAAARLCYSASDIESLTQKVSERDQSSFLQKLSDMNHLSPIEHATFTFGIEGVSRSLLAQITRHRIASFSVQSQRYVAQDGGEGFDYVIPPSVEALGVAAAAEYRAQMDTIARWYTGWRERFAKAAGAPENARQAAAIRESANEDARFVLPNAAATRMMVTMNARELHHFFRLRCCNRAQWEIREVAWQMLRLAKQAAPLLFQKAGPACVFGACSEGKMTCGKAAQVRRHYRQMEDGMASAENG